MLNLTTEMTPETYPGIIVIAECPDCFDVTSHPFGIADIAKWWREWPKGDWKGRLASQLTADHRPTCGQ